MGAVTFSLDPALFDCLRAALGLDVFVETGTFEGATAALAASRVAEVHTVELSEEFYRRARERLSDLKSVHVYHGDSATVLKQLRPRLAGRAVLYWLDAHWCDAGSTAGAESQCPLLDELAAIGELNADSAVLVDDARLFLCPPAGSHRSEQWPSLDQILRRLLSLGSGQQLMIFNDVICLFPARAARALRELALTHAFDWLGAADKARAYDQMLEQMQGKDLLIGRLHSEAEQMRQMLAETHERLRQSEEGKRLMLEHPVRLAGQCAKAVAKKCGRAVLRRKSA
jgi:hypothetical protein